MPQLIMQSPRSSPRGYPRATPKSHSPLRALSTTADQSASSDVRASPPDVLPHFDPLPSHARQPRRLLPAPSCRLFVLALVCTPGEAVKLVSRARGRRCVPTSRCVVTLSSLWTLAPYRQCISILPFMPSRRMVHIWRAALLLGLLSPLASCARCAAACVRCRPTDRLSRAPLI